MTTLKTIMLMVAAVTMFMATTATADAKNSMRRSTPVECGAHLMTEAHADDHKGMEAVLNSFVERADKGHGGNLCAAIYAKGQAYAVWKPKNMLWKTEPARWERAKTFVAAKLAKYEQTGTVLSADMMHFKGCTMFDNVKRPTWGSPCGKVGNYFYNPNGKTKIAKNKVKKNRDVANGRRAKDKLEVASTKSRGDTDAKVVTAIASR